MIGLKCSACGFELEVGDLRAGREVTCPHCKQPVPLVSGSRESDAPTRVLRPAGDTPIRFADQSDHPFSSSGAGPGEIVSGHSESSTARAPVESFDFLAPPRGADGIGWLAHYRIVRLLGAGGMGMVFLAEDSQLQRLVALKVVQPEMARDPELRERFLREARAIAAVKSDHIVAVYQVGEEKSLPFLAMEYLEGETLEDRLERDPHPPIEFAIRMGREVALGLAAAHQRGLIHRDIKPANIFLETPSERVKILDFGLARAADRPSHLTEPGVVMGTPDYMAPEQAEGGPVTERCDLFSLGCVLYQVLSGTKPFGSGSTMAVLKAVIMKDPTPVELVNPSVPLPLADLTTRLLAKNAANRPTTARVVADRLESLALQPAGVLSIRSPTRPVPAAPPTPAPPAPPEPPASPRRRVVRAAGLAVAGFLVAAALLASLFLSRPGEHGNNTGQPPTNTHSAATGASASVSAKTGVDPVATPSTHTLNGGGSTFIYSLMEKWATVYRNEKNVKVNYVATGSGPGIQQFISQALDFCCSDAPMMDQQLQQARQSGGEVIHVPLALGGIVPAYNLPAIERPLRFSGPVLADIFLGKIKKWDDPALREINPGVDLPDQEITVIHRAESSGSTFIFTEFLTKVSKDWQKQFGPSTLVKWPLGVGARGNEGIVEAIGKRPGAIGYVELLYALQSKIRYGLVKNKAGNYVHASLESVVAAVEGASSDIPPDFRFTLAYAPGKDAYPICGCTWAIIHVRQPDGKGQRLVEFLRWVSQEGQEYNTDLFYARLPQSLSERVALRLKEVRIGE